MPHLALIEDLAVILCIAGFVTVFFQKIKQPPILGYLLAGLIIGPYTPPFSFLDDEKEIKILAELGVIFLLFSLGLHFSYQKLKTVGLPALIIGLFEVIMMIIVGFLAGNFLDWPVYDSILLGSALSISSTTIIIKVLEELNVKKNFFAELMAAVLLIEDLLAILLMVFIANIGSATNPFSFEMVFSTAKLLGVVISWFLVGYLLIPFFMRKIKKGINHETLTIISIGLCLFLSSVAVYFNYSAALGAFIMGSILAETPMARKIEMLTLPIRDVFGAVFFVSVGMLIDPFMIVKYFPVVIFLAILTIFGKIIFSTIGSLLSGQNMTTSLKIGCGMAQIGEFSFIIVGFGGAMRAVDEPLYPVVMAIAAITTFTTPYLLRFSLNYSEKVQKIFPLVITNGIHIYQSWVKNLSLRSKKLLENSEDILRFIINGIVFALIVEIACHFSPLVFPQNFHQNWIQFFVLVIVFLLASPFIWAMLFETKNKFLIIFFIPITLIEASYLASIKFVQKEQYFGLLFIIFTFMIINYNILKKIYFFIEKSLIANLSRKEEKKKFFSLGFSEYEILELKIDEKFPYLGKTIKDSKMVLSFGMNVIAIKREQSLILLPKEQEKLYENDIVILLGDREEMEPLLAFSKDGTV